MVNEFVTVIEEKSGTADLESLAQKRAKSSSPIKIIILGILSSIEGNYDRSLKLLDIGVTLSGDNKFKDHPEYKAISLLTRGIFLYKLNRYKDALEDFDGMLEISSGLENSFIRATGFYYRAETLLKFGRYQEAHESALEARRQFNEYHANGDMSIGAVLGFTWSGKILEDDHFKFYSNDKEYDIRTANPNIKKAYFFLKQAELQKKNGQIKESISYSEKATEIFETEGMADNTCQCHLERGWLLASLGQYQEAIEAYDKARLWAEKIEIEDVIKDTGIAMIASNKAEVLRKAGLKTELILLIQKVNEEYDRKAKEMLDSGDGDKELVILLDNHARILESAGALEEAKEIREKEIVIASSEFKEEPLSRLIEITIQLANQESDIEEKGRLLKQAKDLVSSLRDLHDELGIDREFSTAGVYEKLIQTLEEKISQEPRLFVMRTKLFSISSSK